MVESLIQKKQFWKLCDYLEQLWIMPIRFLHPQQLGGIWSGLTHIGCLLTPLVGIQNPGSSIQEEIGPRVVQIFQLQKKQSPRHGGEML